MSEQTITGHELSGTHTEDTLMTAVDRAVCQVADRRSISYVTTCKRIVSAISHGTRRGARRVHAHAAVFANRDKLVPRFEEGETRDHGRMFSDELLELDGLRRTLSRPQIHPGAQQDVRSTMVRWTDGGIHFLSSPPVTNRRRPVETLFGRAMIAVTPPLT